MRSERKTLPAQMPYIVRSMTIARVKFVGAFQRNSEAKKPPSFRKKPRFGAGLADAVWSPFSDEFLFAGGGRGDARAGIASGRESSGRARTSSRGGGAGPFAWNTRGASTCTRSSLGAMEASRGVAVAGTIVGGPLSEWGAAVSLEAGFAFTAGKGALRSFCVSLCTGRLF